MYSLLCKGTSYFISLWSTGERYHETSTTRSISRQLGQSQVRIVQKQSRKEKSTTTSISHDTRDEWKCQRWEKVGLRKKFSRDLLVVVESWKSFYDDCETWKNKSKALKILPKNCLLYVRWLVSCVLVLKLDV